jgi:hypothetical protein
MVIGTGDNMRASNGQAALEAADQPGIVPTVREDTAQPTARFVGAFRAAGHIQAVRQAVTVPDRPRRRRRRRRAPLPRAHALRRAHPHRARRPLRPGPCRRRPHDAVSTGSQETWLRVIAAVADGP